MIKLALISVIVPVYKVEPYLNRCVNSILQQTFSDYELILIDDGSPDRCGVICDEYAEKDNRIHVIHQANGGLSAARNAGLDWAYANSDSEWITFIDSDDWVHNRYLEILYHAVTDDSIDVIIGEYIKTYGDDLMLVRDKPEIHCHSTEEYYVNNIVCSTIACGKLYRRKCFINLRYPLGRIHEDEYVTYRILFKKPMVCVVHEPLYSYFQNSDGIIRSKWTTRRFDSLPACEKQVCFFVENGYLIAARTRFHSLIIQLSEGRDYVNSSDELTKVEKKAWRRKLNQKKQVLMRRYKRYHWITIKNRGLFLQAYDIFFPPFRLIRAGGILLRRIFGKTEG